MNAAWQAHVAAAAVGGPAPSMESLPEPVAGVLSEQAALPERLAALVAYRAAGTTPDADGFMPFAPTAVTGTPCGRRASDLLAIAMEMQEGDALVIEWCSLAVRAGIAAPPELAAALSGRIWRLDPAGAATAAAALGPLRAAIGELPGAPRTPAPTPAVRAIALAIRRSEDREAAMAELVADWSGEDAETRQRLVAAIGVRLVPDDEPFLEACLDDRSGKVRTAAAGLLARIPGSRLSCRMEERARTWVRRPMGWPLRKRITVSGLALTDDLRRDGLTEEEHAVHHAVSAAPLRTWFEAEPAAWIDAIDLPAQKGLLLGWTDATVREGDTAWSGAIARRATGRYGHALLDAATARVLPWCPGDVSAAAVRHLSRANRNPYTYTGNLNPPWPPALTLALADCWLGAGEAWAVATGAKMLAEHGHPSCLSQVEAAARKFRDGSDGLSNQFRAAMDRIGLRAEMRKELAE